MPQISDLQVRQAIKSPNGATIDQEGSQGGVAFGDAVHGEYAAAAIAGRLFYAANQAAVSTVTTLNTAWTGLAIENPASSSKLIVIREFSWAFTVIAAAGEEGALALAVSTGTFSKVITPVCCREGAGSSIAVVDTAATVVAGAIVKPIATLGDAAASVMMSVTGVVKLGGQIVLPPGYAVKTDTTVAFTTDHIFGFLWEEISI